jgi:hypothetical protein
VIQPVDKPIPDAVNVNDADQPRSIQKSAPTEERRQAKRRKVRELLQKGKTFKVIRKELGCSREFVRSVAKEAGIRRTGREVR